MICPQCKETALETTLACPACSFEGELVLLERLSNLDFLLEQVEVWRGRVPAPFLKWVQTHYGQQQREVEIALGVRQPPPDATEAAVLRQELGQLRYWQRVLSIYVLQGRLSTADGHFWQEKATTRIAEIETRLEYAPPVAETPPTKQAARRLDNKRFALSMLPQLPLSERDYQAAVTELEADITALEIELGLRPSPQPEPAAATQPQPKATIEDSQEATTSPKPKRQRHPWTWDRLWEGLLSERTLRAVLFLGVLLVVAAAGSWVATNWQSFPAIAQLGILGAGTALFFAAGWYVRVQLDLRESGIALSAVGALLVPLDFFVFYISGGFPAGSWPQVWLAASVVCLIIYLLVTYLIQASFFGYLVSLALTSLVIASLNLLGAEMAWWQTGGALVALFLAALSRWRLPSSWQVLSSPMGQMALIITIPLLAVGVGIGYIQGGQSSAFYLALAVTWWLGGAALAFMISRYPMRSLILVATLSFLGATWLTQSWVLAFYRWPGAWQGIGFALLAAVYLSVGHWRVRGVDENKASVERQIGRQLLQVGGLSLTIAAIWSLLDLSAAQAVHLLLALIVIGLAYRWQQPRWLWLMSLFLTVSASAWQGSQGAAEPAELALSWALLSIIHILAAIQLRHLKIRYDAPLYGAALLLAGAALLPPLILQQRLLLTYALGHWLGLTIWLAYLTHTTAYPGIQTFLTAIKRPQTLFHWLATAAVVPWLWLVWPPEQSDTLPIGLALAAWVLMILSVRLRRLHWAYGKPWQVMGHITAAAALISGYGYVGFPNNNPQVTLLLIGLLYLLFAWVLRQRTWFIWGGLLWAAGVQAAVSEVSNDSWSFVAQAGVVLFYMVGAGLAEQFLTKDWPPDKGRQLLTPLYQLTTLWARLLLLWGLIITLNDLVYEYTLVVPAIGWGVLGLGVGLHAWLFNNKVEAHASIWLLVFAAALVAQEYSRGSGRSAALAALLALVLVLAERGLFWLARQGGKGILPAVWRQGWRLYRQPLLWGGWLISLGTIGLALVRNMLWLAGGTTRQGWSIVALLIVLSLYLLSSWFFRRLVFAWAAALLVIAPWTLWVDLVGQWLGSISSLWLSPYWVLLSLGLLGLGGWLQPRSKKAWGLPPQIVAHGLVVWAFLWGVFYADVTTITAALAICFYLIAVWLDRRTQPVKARFWYPALILMPVMLSALLSWIRPATTLAHWGVLLWLFVLPALFIARWLTQREPVYRWPFYCLAYGGAVIAILLAMDERPYLIILMMLNVGLSLLSAWLFWQPTWQYGAAILLPGATLLFLAEIGLGSLSTLWYYGWALIALAGLYLLITWVLERLELERYGQPWFVCLFPLVLLSLPYCIWHQLGALVGFTAAAAIYGLVALWQRWPLLLHVVLRLAGIAYWVLVVFWLEVELNYLGFAFWPGIFICLATAWWLDKHWGIEPTKMQLKLSGPFPWEQPGQWVEALWQRFSRWWALSFYIVAFMSVVWSALFGIFLLEIMAWHPLVTLSLGTAVFAYALFRFRLRGWLLLAWGWLQLTAVALIYWIGWHESPVELALAFLPMTVLTAIVGVLITELLSEGSPFTGWSAFFRGWSRPLLWLLALDILIGQWLALLDWQSAASIVTLIHTLLLLGLATLWRTRWLAFGTVSLGFISLSQLLAWGNVFAADRAVAWALLALLYGAVGYGLRFWREQQVEMEEVWGRPLRWGAWLISTLALLLLSSYATDLTATFLYNRLGTPLGGTQAQIIEAVILTLAILGPFYLTAALVERWRWLAYGALLLLLNAWTLWLLILEGLQEYQLYAIPAGGYLLLVGWAEWQFGKRELARWIEWAGIFLWFGSAFWQSFTVLGQVYALVMIVEGLLLVWLGSVRRLRRLLYAGVAGVVIAVGGQLVEPLLALNVFVLLLLGLLLVLLGIALERRLDQIRQLSQEWQLKLENWE